jgi:hypothetical protein
MPAVACGGSMVAVEKGCRDELSCGVFCNPAVPMSPDSRGLSADRHCQVLSRTRVGLARPILMQKIYVWCGEYAALLQEIWNNPQ